MMMVRDLMSSDVSSCGPRTNAAAVAEILWNKDCGALPVIDEKNKILGIVTDRDLFIALGTRNRPAADVAIEDVMSKPVATCSPDDDLKKALETMQARRIRRLPVVDRENTLRGILSVDDVIRRAGVDELPHPTVMSILKTLSEPRRKPEPTKAAPAAPQPARAAV